MTIGRFEPGVNWLGPAMPVARLRNSSSSASVTTVA